MLFVCLFVCLFPCLLVCLFVCLFVCLLLTWWGWQTWGGDVVIWKATNLRASSFACSEERMQPSKQVARPASKHRTWFTPRWGWLPLGGDVIIWEATNLTRCTLAELVQLWVFKQKWILYQHGPQTAWKDISDFLQVVSSRFTRYIFFHRKILVKPKYRYRNNQTQI